MFIQSNFIVNHFAFLLPFIVVDSLIYMREVTFNAQFLLPTN